MPRKTVEELAKMIIGEVQAHVNSDGEVEDYEELHARVSNCLRVETIEERASSVLERYEASHGWDLQTVRDLFLSFVDDENLIEKFKEHLAAKAESDDMHTFD